VWPDSPGHPATLRAASFADTEIFEAAFVTAYFNCTTRVAEGLGIEPKD
jgi:alkylhydroperoxidase family enzyme